MIFAQQQADKTSLNRDIEKFVISWDVNDFS